MSGKWGMDREQRLQQFSFAYVRAVAATAGFPVQEITVDEDSIDLQLQGRGAKGPVRSPRLEVQVKATTRNVMRDDGIHFPLPIKNYNDLRPEDVLVPRILVAVLVPRKIDRWIHQSEGQLAMCRCGYWLSLCGREPTSNSHSVTVVLPRENILSAEALDSMMKRISRRESL